MSIFGYLWRDKGVPKGSIGHVFTVCIRTENQNQASFSSYRDMYGSGYFSRDIGGYIR